MERFGLIGFPLEHSFSKRYFTEKFEKEELKDHKFDLFPIPTIEEFPQLISSEKDLKGLAVTIPYKESVIPYLSSLSRHTREIGAVNCIKISGDSLVGYNTDATGFERSLSPLLRAHHTQALVLGTGGASKAVQYSLQKLGIPFLLVTRKENAGHGFINYHDINKDIISLYPVIINCTPVGMYPNELTAPAIPYAMLDKRNLLYDLVYKPSQTKFLSMGAKSGAIVKNGYEMLLIQAEENFKIWKTPVL